MSPHPFTNHLQKRGKMILFDGVCNLCDYSVQFIFKRDPRGHFMFASLQSDLSRSYLVSKKYRINGLNSVMLLEGENIFTESSAVLRMLRSISGWRFLYCFILIPKPIRDAIYQYVAKNRYKWFGKKEQCMIPTPELRARFFD